MQAIALFVYIAFLIFVVGYLLRQIGRMANAQEEVAKHLYEIAKDVKAIAIHNFEKK